MDQTTTQLSDTLRQCVLLSVQARDDGHEALARFLDAATSSLTEAQEELCFLTSLTDDEREAEAIGIGKPAS